MACSIFVMILSLICLLYQWDYHLNQQASLSTINKTLDSEDQEDESPFVG